MLHTSGSIDHPYYRLETTISIPHFVIRGTILHGPLSTTELPLTGVVLRKYIPQIFSCECINDNNLPFSEELRQTEVSHLLEHIILEYLCEELLFTGADMATFEGNTRWYKDAPEQFEIYISRNMVNIQIFYKALHRGLLVFNEILQSYQLESIENYSYAISSVRG